MYFYQVAIPVNIDRLFSYSSPTPIPIGCRVLVSFSNSMRTGIIWQEEPKPDASIQYKQILEIIDTESLLFAEQLRLAGWMSKYYCAAVGKVLLQCFPAG